MDYITIGTMVNTHGLKGEVKIKPQTHFVEERFAKRAHIFLQYENNLLELEIKSVREHKGMLLVCFEGYTDINQVEAWKGSKLFIKEEQLTPLDEDEIYYRDLLDMQVETTSGQELGNVSEIIETGANIVIRVKGEREVLIPYVKTFIKEVHMEDKKLIVELLDGML